MKEAGRQGWASGSASCLAYPGRKVGCCDEEKHALTGHSLRISPKMPVEPPRLSLAETQQKAKV